MERPEERQRAKTKIKAKTKKCTKEKAAVEGAVVQRKEALDWDEWQQKAPDRAMSDPGFTRNGWDGVGWSHGSHGSFSVN